MSMNIVEILTVNLSVKIFQEPFMKRKRKTDQIIQFIEDTVEKYGMVE